jgi:hypothetical protein
MMEIGCGKQLAMSISSLGATCLSPFGLINLAGTMRLRLSNYNRLATYFLDARVPSARPRPRHATPQTMHSAESNPFRTRLVAVRYRKWRLVNLDRFRVARRTGQEPWSSLRRATFSLGLGSDSSGRERTANTAITMKSTRSSATTSRPAWAILLSDTAFAATRRHACLLRTDASLLEPRRSSRRSSKREGC